MSTHPAPPANRTFYPRRGRVSKRHETGLEQLYPRHGVSIDTVPLDLSRCFGRPAPVVLEIGSGMGDTTAAMAAADPDRDYLAVEVHPPGVANLLWHIEERGLTNLRVHDGDAVELLDRALAPGVLDAVHVFFPDPWPKPRHHKRRLISPERIDLLTSRLRPGGTLHCATDWSEYAQVMLGVLSAADGLVNAHPGFAPRMAARPVTKFEQRGVAAGRDIFDLEFRRTVTAE